MKVLKYLFLLAILFLIASTIFIATLNPDYKIVRTQIVTAPRSTVFNYVNNLKNWEDFGYWKQVEPTMKIIYPKNTIGKGAFYTWKSKDGNGKIITISIKQNENITQKMKFAESKSDVYWSFKDTIGKTKITWTTTGKIGFFEKMYVNFSGGSDKIIGTMYEKSLLNINKNLGYELQKHKIVVNGYLQKSGGLYLHKTVISKNENVTKNIQILITNMMQYCDKNYISVVGKPFVIYNQINDNEQTTNLSVCIHLKNQTILKPNSGYTVANLVPFQAVKTTLTGDYSHFKSVKEKALECFYTNKLVDDNLKKRIEVYVKTKKDTKKPSEWITEIYFPAKSNATAYKPTNNQVVDTNKVVVPQAINVEPLPTN